MTLVIHEHPSPMTWLRVSLERELVRDRGLHATRNRRRRSFSGSWYSRKGNDVEPKTIILTASLLSLFVAVTPAHATRGGDIKNEICAIAGKEIRKDSTPAEIVTFLKSHHFYPTEYAHQRQRMSGYSMYTGDGTYTTDSMQAVFAVDIDFRFDEHDRLKDYQVDVQQVDQ